MIDSCFSLERHRIMTACSARGISNQGAKFALLLSSIRGDGSDSVRFFSVDQGRVLAYERSCKSTDPEVCVILAILRIVVGAGHCSRWLHALRCSHVNEKTAFDKKL